MQIAPFPEDEDARLLELRSFGILDSLDDPDFNNITELARRIAGTEIGIISLVDQDRQWFKSCVGVDLAQQQTPRSISFCSHTILQRQPLIIADAASDPRFADNPLVTAEPHLRFYAGFPLITVSGFALGSLCAISRTPHQLDAGQVDSLRRLAELTVRQLSHLRQAALLNRPDPGQAERLPASSIREALASLEQLLSRDQLLRSLELVMAMRVESSFALLRCRFIDYDRVNSTLGGVVAEQYINEAARRVIAAVPRGSSVSRFADADLLVLLPFEGSEENAEKVAERILGFATTLFRSGPHALALTLSIGIAICRDSYDSIEEILADTSMAVRMAMRSPGSAFRFIDAQTRVVARESYRLESELREALSARAIEPFLQPIVDAATAELQGFEALARWVRGAERLPPGEFLPMMTASGLTGELDLLIIEKSLAAMPLLALHVPQRSLVMSVNLSGILLEDLQLRTRLLRLVDDNPAPPGWTLQMELLEDAFQYSGSIFDQFLADLSSRGVSVVIDDFGTGYSSLARLMSLPVTGVKLDRVFVQRLDDAEDSPRTLLRTMIAMVHDLGLTITAEGVETASQRDWLVRAGVTRAQGFLFHHPMPVDQVMDCLADLQYRPGALPVDPRRLNRIRRQQRHSGWRIPFLDRRRRS
jgi:diguanylate cyclase